MNSASMRVWSFATVILIILVVALGWFLGIAPKLAEAARFDTERLAVQAQNELTRAAIGQLEADFERIDELRAELAVLRAEFPTQAEYDDAVEEFITSILAEDLVLQNLQITEPSPSTAAVLGPDEQVPEPELDGDGVLPAGSLLLVSVSITVFGPLDDTLAFVDALQQSPRFGVVPSVDYNNESGSGGQTTITLNIYVITGDDLVDIPPVEPAPEPSAEPTPSPTPGASDPSATPTPGEPTPAPTP